MADPPAAVEPVFRCGYVGVCGRPNVGKSSLMNRLVGQKLSITARKPHTTRWHVLGVHTTQEYQVLYKDMPGLQRRGDSAMNRFLHRETADALLSVDVVLLVVEALQWQEADDYVLDNLQENTRPVVCAVNKIDCLADRRQLLPFLEQLDGKHTFEAIVPVSARRGEQLAGLERLLVQYLPEQPALFPEDQLSDRNERFFIAELLREQLIRHLGEEVPYRLTVTIERMHMEAGMAHIHALVWVESDSQKAIVIGRDGARLKRIATAARQSMERFLDTRVNLKTWVKVRKDWTDDQHSLREFGYDR